MRDLAEQNLSSPKKAIRKTHLRVLIMVAVIGAILVLVKSNLISGSLGGSSVILRDAQTGLTPISADGTGGIAQSGVDLKTETVNLVDVKYQGEARGVASRSLTGGTYILSVEATLPDPKGPTYEVWVTDGVKVLSVDFMKGSKTSWFLRVADTKFAPYDTVWITLERAKEDNKPEEHVLEGSF